MFEFCLIKKNYSAEEVKKIIKIAYERGLNKEIINIEITKI